MTDHNDKVKGYDPFPQMLLRKNKYQPFKYFKYFDIRYVL